MPLFDFKCKSCNFVFEDFLKNSETTTPNCTKCGNPTERQYSRFSGIVPGSSNRSIDCIIGADAEKRWNIVDKRMNNKKRK